MGQLAEGLLSLSGWTALALLFALPALEAPAFLGLVLPGELVLVLGGVLAHHDRVPLGAAPAVGTAGVVVLIRRRPDPSPAVFGYHEVWHAFTVAAGVCHFAFIWLLATAG